ncbi:MAG: hypothetical protein HYW47_03160 [Deltaproteobacteria bacterium]|nr:hypothetical protein [Deltaproteobacteria bacterium]
MKKIFLIDPDSHTLLKLSEDFEQLGHVISAFKSIQDALDETHLTLPDLIILSDKFEDEEISELSKELQASVTTHQIPICVVTNHPQKYISMGLFSFEPPLKVEKIQFLLQKKQSQTSFLEEDIFDEVFKELLGEEKQPEQKEEVKINTKSVPLKSIVSDLEEQLEKAKQESEKFKKESKKKQEEKEGTNHRELEHKIDILKRDSQVLLQAKDKKILDLKRKIDALELELSEISQRLKNSHEKMDEWQNKSSRSLKALKLAITQLEGAQEDLDKTKKSA